MRGVILMKPQSMNHSDGRYTVRFKTGYGLLVLVIDDTLQSARIVADTGEDIGTVSLVDSQPIAKTKPTPKRKGCKKKRDILHYLKGAVGMAKANLGIDAAPRELVDERWEICKGCPSNVYGSCSECGCPLAYKMAVKSETCPLDPPKW